MKLYHLAMIFTTTSLAASVVLKNGIFVLIEFYKHIGYLVIYIGFT